MSANKSFYRIEKPIGTIYSDYVIKDGKCFAVFEKNDGRVETKKSL